MELEKEIMDEMAKEIQQEIDSSLMNYLMMMHWEEQGWTPVTLSTLQDNRHAVDITMWLHDHGFRDQVNYYRDGRKFLFERAEDATMFIMRWV